MGEWLCRLLLVGLTGIGGFLLGRRMRLTDRQSVLLAGALLAGLLLRWAAVALHPLLFLYDGAEYVHFGRHFLEQFAGGSTRRAPGYPAFLATVFALKDSPGAVGLAQAVLDIGTAALVGVLTCRVAGPHAALAATWCTALCPNLIAATTAGLSETLSALCLTAAVTLWMRAPARRFTTWAAGLTAGAASLCRPSLTYTFLAVALPAWRRPRIVLTVLVGWLMVSGTWIGRNWLLTGRPLQSTLFGENMHLGTDLEGYRGLTRTLPVRYRDVPAAALIGMEPSLLVGTLTDLQPDRYRRYYKYAEVARISTATLSAADLRRSPLYRLRVWAFAPPQIRFPGRPWLVSDRAEAALRKRVREGMHDLVYTRIASEELLYYLRHHPGWFLVSGVERTLDMWLITYDPGRIYGRPQVWPLTIGFAAQTLLLALAGWGVLLLWRQVATRPAVSSLLLLLAVFTATHVGGYGGPRYALPVWPILCALAGVGCARLRELGAPHPDRAW